MGLEPTTFSLATRRSTTELCPLVPYVLKSCFFKIKQETKWLNLFKSKAKFIYIIFLLMYLTTMEFIKTETPIQMTLEQVRLIKQILFIKNFNKLISVEFENLLKIPKRKYYDFGMEQKKH